MKISEAIMRGAWGVPQNLAGWGDGKTSSCGLKAAIEGAGAKGEGQEVIYRLWPWMRQNLGGRTVADTVIFLNDTMKVSRATLANWLDRVEAYFERKNEALNPKPKEEVKTNDRTTVVVAQESRNLSHEGVGV